MPDLLERLQAALADRYAVESEIGRGGMAVVFLAEDLRHHRQVAIKVLHPELTATLGAERFLHEIEIAAGLNHPHILALYDSGEADGLLYYVMPYAEGESLRQRLDREKQLAVDESVRIAVELADGLDYAHRKGVVHRDIKPGNILLSEGHATIADFGIARAIEAARADRVTSTGLGVGTPLYASPEQATAQETLDGRTDIYSLGCVLYEMLAGQPPLTGATPQIIQARRVSETPSPLHDLRDTVPPALDYVIARALARIPADRYATASQFGQALQAAVFAATPTPQVEVVTPEGLMREQEIDRSRSITDTTSRKLGFIVIGAMAAALLFFVVTRDWSGKQETVARGEITSIAVLPLDNLMNDPQQDYFVQGMHDALIAELARLGGLDRVISRTSVMQYRETDKSVPEIAGELNVDAVVEGTVLRAGDSVRIQAQLIGAFPERHLWAATYDKDLRDVLALHREVARAIADQIRLTLTPEDESRFANSRSVDPEVYELYLKGRYLCRKWTPDEMASAIRYLQQAIDKDPGYAPAHAELASCYTDASFFGYLPPLEVYPRAKAAATRAVDIDDRLAEAYTALGSVAYQLEWNFFEAEKAFKRAIELNPNSSRTLIYYAWMLGETGRFEEAFVPARRSQELDPLSVSANVAVAEAFYLSRNYDEAVKEYRKNLDLSPNDPAVHYFLAWPYEQKGMFEEAIALLEKAVLLSEGAPVYVAALGHTYALAGRRGEAFKILEQLQDPAAPMPPSPFHIALVYVGLGDDDSAFQWLEKAYRERTLQLIYLKAGPKFDRLREDARFPDLLRRLGLER